MSSRRHAGITVIALAVGVVCLFALSHSAAVEAVYPFERVANVFNRVVISRIRGLFAGSAASAENVRLRRELAAASVLRTDVARLRAENERLRSALGFAGAAEGAWIGAEVLSEDGGAAAVRRTLRLGRGTLDGVSEDAVVAVPEGLVGVVAAVTPHTCEVLMLTDPSLGVACDLRLPSGVERITVTGGTVPVFRYGGAAPRDAFIAGAHAVSSGRGGLFPRDLAVGTLARVRTGDAGEVLGGTLESAVDFDALEYVFIRRER